jgi:hypothetical protein
MDETKFNKMADEFLAKLKECDDSSMFIVMAVNDDLGLSAMGGSVSYKTLANSVQTFSDSTRKMMSEIQETRKCSLH